MTCSERSPRRIPWLTALALTGALMAPIGAQGQILLPQQQCVFGEEPFPSACATLLFIEFDGTSVRLIVANTTNAADHQEAVLASLFFEFSAGPLAPFPVEALVEYGTWADGFVANGYSEFWDITVPVPGNPGGSGTSWDLQIKDPSKAGAFGDPDRDPTICDIDPDGEETCDYDSGGNANPGDLRVLPGNMVMITFDYTASEEVLLTEWTARMQSIGPGFEDSGYTTVVPEPATMVLVTTGLLGLAGVRARRRRRG